jgi:alkaline phosphatase
MLPIFPVNMERQAKTPMKPYPISHCARTTLVLLWALFLVLIQVQPNAAQPVRQAGAPAKYIFLFIGDGMGQAQRMAAEQFSGRPLAMNRMRHQGITTTHAADRFITGSAAAATALASGQKARIGMIGMDPERRRVTSIAELAKAKGMKVGIVTSVSIDHATPAAFYAHVDARRRYYDIAVALADSEFDFFGGGGLSDPVNRSNNSENFRGDALGLIRRAGYTLVEDKATFTGLKPGDGKIMAINPRLPDGNALPYVLDRQPGDIGLHEFTAKAIQMLDNPDGFFLMVEGGKIDWACHANDAATMIHDTLEFDRAVGKGIDFAHKHPRDTLVVVSGDHECGGLSLGWTGTGYETDFSLLSGQTISFQRFSDTVLPGFKADCGIDCDFESVKPIISRYFGLRLVGDAGSGPLVPKANQIHQLRTAFDLSMGRSPDTVNGPNAQSAYSGYDPLTVAITHTLNNMAGLGWTSFQHTGIAVTTTAVGVGAETFDGFYDNTDIAKKIMAVMGIEAKVHVASTPATPLHETVD